jgi:catechol 2,3-dioxygenase-like lactoylglutathione lyase family enzyme
MHTSFSTIGLIVTDLAASMAFYRQLGLAFGETAGEHAECALPGGVRLTLDTERSIRSFTPDWVRPSGSPAVSLGFRAAAPVEVDRAFRELVSSGYRPSRHPWDTDWGQRYASVLDPDGNEIDLFADLTR